MRHLFEQFIVEKGCKGGGSLGIGVLPARMRDLAVSPV
jgi:hypothetical protein